MMRLMSIPVAWSTILAGLLLFAEPALAGSPVEDLSRANAAYEAGRYEEARESYRTLVDAGLHNETLYYNLGCAAARLGRYGEAILAFRRALRYAPGHEDARANLEWVRGRADEAGVEASGGRQLLERAAALMPLDLGLAGGALMLNVAALLAALALLRRFAPLRRALIPAAAIGALLGILLLAPALLQLWLRASERGAVVLDARLEARSGPGEAHPTLFSAHEGLEIRVIDERRGWVRVAVPSGPSGWLPCEGIGTVAPDRLSCAGERRGKGISTR